jgi:hypothetical protein
MAPPSKEQMKKKPTRKKSAKTSKKLVKPSTRSSSKQFESDTDEVNALISTLENHLVTDEKITQDEREQLGSEIQKIAEDVSREQTTVGKILPRLRDIARTTNLPGASKTTKGIWLYSEEIREKGKRDKTERKEGTTPQSPNLLTTPESSLGSSPGSSQSETNTNDNDKDLTNRRAEESSVGETKENETSTENQLFLDIETKSQNLESNQYYELQMGELASSSDSSNSSHKGEEETQAITHQKSPTTEDEQEDETPRNTEIADTIRDSQPRSESDVFTERIKSGLNDLDARKKQLEKSLGARIHEAKNRLVDQATEQHDKFTNMAANNMRQYNENVQNLVSNKLQELHDATTNWKENYERAVKHTSDTQNKAFERKCQVTQKRENDKAERIYSNQEKKLQTKADGIELELLNQAQSLLDQLPMDMGEVKQELEMELREYGDKVRQGIKAAQNEQHLQQLGDSLMAELQVQATGHKSDMNSMMGPNREYNTLPTHAQHTERMRLRNEIATEIRNDLGLNTANAQWTRLRREVTEEMESKLATSTNEAQDEIGGRIALAEVAINKLTDKMQEQLEDKGMNTTMQLRISQLEESMAEHAHKTGLKCRPCKTESPS